MRFQFSQFCILKKGFPIIFSTWKQCTLPLPHSRRWSCLGRSPTKLGKQSCIMGLFFWKSGGRLVVLWRTNPALLWDLLRTEIRKSTECLGRSPTKLGKTTLIRCKYGSPLPGSQCIWGKPAELLPLCRRWTCCTPTPLPSIIFLYLLSVCTIVWKLWTPGYNLSWLCEHV